MDRGAWWATVHGITELDRTERLRTDIVVPKAKHSLRCFTRAQVGTKTVSLEVEGKFHCH